VTDSTVVDDRRDQISNQRMLRGMGASEICFALQSCRLSALLTMLIIGEACSSLSFGCCWFGPQHLNHNDVLFPRPRHLLLHSCLGTTTTTRSVAAHRAHGSLQRSWFEQTNKRKTSRKKRFCSSGCPPAMCPRFATTAPCSGGGLTCSDGKVTAV